MGRTRVPPRPFSPSERGQAKGSAYRSQSRDNIVGVGSIPPRGGFVDSRQERFDGLPGNRLALNSVGTDELDTRGGQEAVTAGAMRTGLLNKRHYGSGDKPDLTEGVQVPIGRLIRGSNPDETIPAGLLPGLNGMNGELGPAKVPALNELRGTLGPGKVPEIWQLRGRISLNRLADVPDFSKFARDSDVKNHVTAGKVRDIVKDLVKKSALR